MTPTGKCFNIKICFKTLNILKKININLFIYIYIYSIEAAKENLKISGSVI